jgi:3',5'-cyclic-AMP phosphodiesterase
VTGVPSSVTGMLPPAAGTLRVLHVSDTHLTGDGTLHNGVVDTTAALDALLERVDGIAGIDLVAVSGDCSDDGSPESYTVLRDRLAVFGRAHRAAVAIVPGNHDGRQGFRQVLVNGHLLGEDGSALMHTLEYLPPSVPVFGVQVVAGRRIVTVDTGVPGAGWGEVSEELLERLRTVLAEQDPAAPHGTVLVLHHPPLPAPTALHHALRLRNPDQLAAVIAGTDVRLVLGGHYHHHFAGTLGGVPVLVAPAVANDTDVAGPYERERVLVGTGALLVDLATDGTVWSTPIRVPRPDDGSVVFDHDEATVSRIAEGAGRPD